MLVQISVVIQNNLPIKCLIKVTLPMLILQLRTYARQVLILGAYMQGRFGGKIFD